MMRVLAIAGVLLSGSTLLAQDIEMTAVERGRKLPEAYYERIKREPDAFELKAGWRNKLARAQATATAVQGTLPLVIIPALFSDSEQPEDFVSTGTLQTRLFDPASTTTVTAYFNEASLGKLNIGGKVTSWVPTSISRATAIGTSFGLGSEARVRDWIRDAITNVDAQIDFGQFDNDGPDGVPNSGDDDGRVDGAAFLFREIDAACGGPGIWPHRSRLGLTAGVTTDRRPNGLFIVVDDYMVLGSKDCTGQSALAVNVFAHETGHVLGLPDYYDSSGGLLREQRRWVVGCWELMSGGSWGCGIGPQPASLVPPHLGAYPKSILGWNNVTALTSVGIRPQQFTLRAAHASGDALRIPLSNTEFLYVEYRPRAGYDVALPAGGILVYHVETGRAFIPCQTCPRRWSYMLLEADGDSALSRPETQGGNRGAGPDAFGNSKFVIDDTTTPSTRLNAGGSTWVRISKMVIDAAQGLARITVSLAPSRITIEKLVAAFGMSPLPNEDQTLLDAGGNANGRYDVGDLRAYLRYRSEDP